MPTDHTLVIVESPTKAKTIKGFLPKDFQVLASMGHIRHLPNNASEISAKHKGEKWATIGVNTTADFDPLYVVPKDKKKIVKELKQSLKGASELLLATDEDREGESISWHLMNVLDPKIPVKRMVFHEITKEAISKALDDEVITEDEWSMLDVLRKIIGMQPDQHAMIEESIRAMSEVDDNGERRIERLNRFSTVCPFN